MGPIPPIVSRCGLHMLIRFIARGVLSKLASNADSNNTEYYLSYSEFKNHDNYRAGTCICGIVDGAEMYYVPVCIIIFIRVAPPTCPVRLNPVVRTLVSVFNNGTPPTFKQLTVRLHQLYSTCSNVEISFFHVNELLQLWPWLPTRYSNILPYVLGTPPRGLQQWFTLFNTLDPTNALIN